MLGLEIEISYAGYNKEVTIITAKGYIDTTTTPAMNRAIQTELASSHFNIIVNLQDVNYISSAGWGVFVAEISEIRSNNGDLVLANMNPDVYNIFELMEFSSILKSFDSLKKALSFFLGAELEKQVSAQSQLSVESNKIVEMNRSTGQSTVRIHDVSSPQPVRQIKTERNNIYALTQTELGKRLLKIIMDRPFLDIKEIVKALKLPEFGGKKGRRREVKRELIFMDLLDKKKRYDFVMKKKESGE